MTSLLASENNLTLHSEQDALDTLSSGLKGCIFTSDDLGPDFFELSNGIAGATFQKFANYSFPVAIVIPKNHNLGQRVTELVRDHKAHPCVRFYSSITEAQEWLLSKA